MTKRGEVSDFAMRDMMSEPMQVETNDLKEGPEKTALVDFLNKASLKVNAENGTNFDTALFLTPSRQERGVIDAKPLAQCDLCKQEVWVSPSSVPRLNDSIKICTDCLLKGAIL
jgi:hypothetical protein